MRQIKIIFLLLAGLCLIVGFIDVYLQIINDDPIRWRVPIILIGFGIGIPLVIWPSFEWNSESDSRINMSEEEYAQSSIGGGILSNATGESSPYENSSGNEGNSEIEHD